ncbi:DUF1801 domain-containing protein [Neolewinella persica]|uniref:DUF1801 domain-containing protein n=1 Tax=Neolewinella persica TaxID=70998 RepID=UPI00035D96BF|nr:DUF1801 domain-containing protein [Neolewinella persica]
MLKIKTDPRVEPKFETYPPEVRERLMYLRKLILEVAAESDTIGEIEETLKWGEPSYLTKKGSTLRMDWKARAPDQYAMYFKCTSKLVDTFKVVHGDIFRYENSRAILFKLEEEVPVAGLKSCISAALHYHLVKQLPDLGM